MTEEKSKQVEEEANVQGKNLEAALNTTGKLLVDDLDDEAEPELTAAEKQALADEKERAKAEQTELVARAADAQIWGWLCEQKWWLALGFPFMCLASLGDMVVPIFIGMVIDAMEEGNQEAVVDIIKIWVIFLTIGAFCTFFNKIIFGYTCELIGTRIREDLFEKVIRKDVAFFDKTKTGEIISRIQSDTLVVQEGLSTQVAMCIQLGIFAVVVLAIMFNISWLTTIVALGLLIPGASTGPLYAKKNRDVQKEFQDAKAAANTVAEAQISNVRTVKAFAEEKGSLKKFKLKNEAVYEVAQRKAIVWGWFMFFMKFFTTGSLAGLILFVSNQVKNEKLSIGDVMAYMLYMQIVSRNIGEIANAAQGVAKVQGAAKGIATLIVEKTTIDFLPKGTGAQPKYSDTTKEHIKLDNIEFAYPSKLDVPILRDVTIDVPKNKVVALVGGSGCGKSSIISLVERWYDPSSGKITYNGEELSNLDNDWYHQCQVSLVQQEPILFSCSIRDNILYGVDISGKTPAEVDYMLDEACRKASCLDFIKNEKIFPEGYETEVGERGVRLSGGQKQRVAIARALIRDPEVILLDEATSALDTESEHQVQLAIDKLCESGGKTVMVIAHRLSTIKNADKIICLKYGEVAEQGTHDELIAMKGVYKQLVDRQMQKTQHGL